MHDIMAMYFVTTLKTNCIVLRSILAFTYTQATYSYSYEMAHFSGCDNGIQIMYKITLTDQTSQKEIYFIVLRNYTYIRISVVHFHQITG